jgi:hypothetical protein
MVPESEDQGDSRQPVRVLTNTPKRLAGALAAYGVLIALACVLLNGKILLAVVALFVGLVAKTLIAWKAGW